VAEKRSKQEEGGGTVFTVGSARVEEGQRNFVGMRLRALTCFNGGRPGQSNSDREMVGTGGEGGNKGGGGGGEGYRGGHRRGGGVAGILRPAARERDRNGAGER
jgi:hypothetical protein